VPEPERIPRERLAELVSAASYGTVLVLAALSVIGVSDVALGVGSELVAGVGVATFLAHLFAELLANHVRYHQPLRGDEILRDMVDGSPILFSTVLPALMLMLGRFDVLGDNAARIMAILVTVLQLLAIGALVGRLTPRRSAAHWVYAALTAAAGLSVVALTVLLGH
jgi:hypothetical protein